MFSGADVVLFVADYSTLLPAYLIMEVSMKQNMLRFSAGSVDVVISLDLISLANLALLPSGSCARNFKANFCCVIL